MSIRRVSQNNAFSRYTCITSHYIDHLTPLPHDCCRHRPFLQIRKITHLSAKMLIGFLDDVSWEVEEDLEELGGFFLRSHHVIWEVGGNFHERGSALIYTSSPFQIIYLCVLGFLPLFFLPVLSNQYELSFHWYSDIYPSWLVRVYYPALFLSIPVWHTCHSPLPSFHLSCLLFLDGENCPLLDSIISCRSNKEVPLWSPLFFKDDHWFSFPNGLNVSRCHRGPRNIFDLFFIPNGVWVAARHPWELVSWSGGENGRSFVF